MSTPTTKSDANEYRRGEISGQLLVQAAQLDACRPPLLDLAYISNLTGDTSSATATANRSQLDLCCGCVLGGGALADAVAGPC